MTVRHCKEMNTFDDSFISGKLEPDIKKKAGVKPLVTK